MHTAVVIDQPTFYRVAEDRGLKTAKEAAESLGLSQSFYSQVLSGARGVSLLFVSRVYSRWGIPFDPGSPGSVYSYSEEEDIIN